MPGLQCSVWSAECLQLCVCYCYCLWCILNCCDCLCALQCLRLGASPVVCLFCAFSYCSVLLLEQGVSNDVFVFFGTAVFYYHRRCVCYFLFCSAVCLSRVPPMVCLLVEISPPDFRSFSQLRPQTTCHPKSSSSFSLPKNTNKIHSLYICNIYSYQSLSPRPIVMVM